MQRAPYYIDEDGNLVYDATMEGGSGGGGGGDGGAYFDPETFQVVNGGSMFGTDDYDLFGGSGGSYDPYGGVDTGGSGGWVDTILGSTVGNGVNISIPTSHAPSLNQTLTSIVETAQRAANSVKAAWNAQTITADAALAQQWAILNALSQNLMKYGADGLKSAAERDRRVDPSRLRWDWITDYIDPITGGTTVLQPLTTVPVTTTGGVTLATNSSTMQTLFLVALAFVAWKVLR